METGLVGRAALFDLALDPIVRTWLAGLDQSPPAWYIQMVNDLVISGQRRGWWDCVGDIMLLGADTEQACMNGLKGVFTYDDMTISGAITLEPSFGVSPATVNSYVNTEILVEDLPGVTLEAHSLAIMCTTDLPGSWQEAGGSGTAGLKSFMIRASSGFRSGFWPATDQIIFGGTSASGLTMGVRNNSDGGFCMREQSIFAWSSPPVSLPNADFTFLKSHPAAVGSPNRLLMVMVGNGDWTEELAIAFSEDMTTFAAALGRADDIATLDNFLGSSCFGNNAIGFVTPATMRVFQQSNPPNSDIIDFDDFQNFPGTDWIARPYSAGTTSAETMAADPVATVDLSDTITVTHVDHDLAIGDAVTLASLTASNGFTTAQLNREQIVLSVPTADTFTCKPGGAANATGNAGGADGTVVFRRIRINSSTFTMIGDGRFWGFAWSDRGERETSGGPITSPIVKPNDLNPPIIRRTAPFNGVSCRTAYTTYERAIGATLVYIAHLCGYADRDDVDDPLGQGYLDIAEAHDLVEADVRTWQDLVDNKETVFDTSLQGFAVCYDIARLSPLTLADMTQGWPSGVILDLEHSDRRSFASMTAFMLRAADICAAKGYQFAWLGHAMNGDSAVKNGFSPGPDGNAPTIINYANVAFANIISRQISSPPGVADFLDAQRDYFVDSGGNVPLEKLMVSCALGTGQQAMTLERCAEVTDWMQNNDIGCAHISRVAMSQGGHEERMANKQTAAYLPNITTRQITASQFMDAFDRDVVIGAIRKAQVEGVVQGLMDDGTWWEIDLLLLLAAENSGQALRCIKNRTLAIVAGAPSFTADRGYTFDGVDDYLTSSFIPKTNGVHMGGDSQMLAVWERTSSEHAGYSAASVQSASRNLAILANDAATGHSQMQANSTLTQAGASGVDTGFFGVTRIGTDLHLATVRASDAVFGSSSAIVPASALDQSTREIIIGARNNVGVIDGFRSCQLSAVVAGSGLSIADMQLIGTRIRNHLVLIGAV